MLGRINNGALVDIQLRNFTQKFKWTRIEPETKLIKTSKNKWFLERSSQWKHAKQAPLITSSPS